MNLRKNNFISIFISLYSDSIDVDPSDNSKKIEIKVDLVSTLFASRYICLFLVVNNRVFLKGQIKGTPFSNQTFTEKSSASFKITIVSKHTIR